VSIYSLNAQSPCDIVTFEYGNVCQCTENYCDRITPLGIIPNGQAALYESTSENAGTHRLTRLANLQFETQPNPNITDLIRINYTSTYQTIIGFGGAFTDSSAIVTHQLSDKLQKIFLEQYFGEDGLHYNIGRIPMAAADFSPYFYTYAPVWNDFDLNNFSISDELSIKIPFIKSAMNMSNETIYFFGSPWYAPDWLKNSRIHVPLLVKAVGFTIEEFSIRNNKVYTLL
jgi:glucosylceramidase